MQTIRVDYNNMMQEFIGSAQGIGMNEIEALKPVIQNSYNAVQSRRGSGMMGWTELPYNQNKIVNDINITAEEVRSKFSNFVVLGIGGSALGPMAVFNALCHLHHNDLPKRMRKAPKFYVEDNIDPDRMDALLDVIDVKKTMFNVITKSGATSETMSQYLIIIDKLKERLGAKYARHIIATTDMKKGNLIKLALAEGFKTYFIPDGVGGRFSELCPVGLLPAAVLGIDIWGLLQGAAHMDEVCKNPDIMRNPALMTAVLQYIAMKKGKNISVMMPYSDRLRLISDWYCQLWAESLGKSVDRNGNVVHTGQTPVKALGVTDQHSQVQLYTEGPFDKVVTFIGVDNYRSHFEIARGCEDIPDVGFLGGHTLNELIKAEQKATEYALTKAGRLNYTIMVPEVTACYVGQLLYLFEMQTAYCGELLNIDAYNQPGVEEGKNATYALLGKRGYELKRQELDSSPKKKEEYII